MSSVVFEFLERKDSAQTSSALYLRQAALLVSTGIFATPVTNSTAPMVLVCGVLGSMARGVQNARRRLLGVIWIAECYNRSKARFLDTTGNEHRDAFDARYAGTDNHIDWDVEGMHLSEHVGNKTIGAWALGSLAGFTQASVPWTPRVGIQVDAASGDNHLGDGRIGTFNSLFPSGYYFALAGYTGYTNLIHVKPSLIPKLNSTLSLLAGVGLHWRETSADALYQQGSAVVPGTARHGSPWTGFYTQLRADYAVNVNLAAAVEAVHFQVGPSLRELSPRNADCVAPTSNSDGRSICKLSSR